jgi:hypothetical protein
VIIIRLCCVLIVAILAVIGEARADESLSWLEGGKLLETSGVSQLEGAGGGGLAAWSLITGYESRDGIGANAHYTYVGLPNFSLNSGGVALGLFDRVELSYTRLSFDTGGTGAALGLGRGFTFDEDVVGAKLRMAGDAVYDQDSWLPQLAIGLQYKENDRRAVIKAVGGQSDSGVDMYVAATKLFLNESLLLDATLRATKANQFGILGFGGDRNNGYQPEFEGSAVLLLSRNLVSGVEYRTKPDNLGFSHENNAYDLFIAYFLNKHLSATLAFVGLGEIATKRDQNGAYLSIQTGW